MDINSYGYVILVAGLGMAIVFLFLWLLSGLMSLIKIVFGGEGRVPRQQKQESVALNEAVPVAYRGKNWVIAAAVAFLEAEALDQSSDPTPWTSGRAHHEDPWLTAPSRGQM